MENTALHRKPEYFTKNNNIKDDDDSIHIMNELEDRQRRASNIIIHNVQESNDKTHLAKANQDTNAVRNLFSDIGMEVDIKKTFRLGKYAQDKCRPFKVMLGSMEEKLYIVKNKCKLNVPGIKIFSDQTKIERAYFLKIRNRLNDLIANGETNKTIRYINNIPTIVDKQGKEQKN